MIAVMGKSFKVQEINSVDSVQCFTASWWVLVGGGGGTGLQAVIYLLINQQTFIRHLTRVRTDTRERAADLLRYRMTRLQAYQYNYMLLLRRRREDRRRSVHLHCHDRGGIKRLSKKWDYVIKYLSCILCSLITPFHTHTPTHAYRHVYG